MRNLLLLTAFLAACQPAPSADDGPAQSCTDSGRRTGLITSLKFSRPDEQGQIAGFDLDGAVTASGDATGCGRKDDVGVDGVGGVDASFNALLPALELTEGAALEEDVRRSGERRRVRQHLRQQEIEVCVGVGMLGRQRVGAEPRRNSARGRDPGTAGREASGEGEAEEARQGEAEAEAEEAEEGEAEQEAEEGTEDAGARPLADG